ncbi:MAG TPA: glycosyltransferase [Candidatus Binatia bacterium]|nr:glycosyltransferase [Candidatus Binatia bacterium]
MRVLQVVHGFPPRELAGAELVTFYLSQALRGRGHQVTVLTRIADPEAPEFSTREEQMHGLTVVRMVNNHLQTSAALRFSYNNSFCDIPLLQVLERFQPDVVHFQHLAHFSVSLVPLVASLGYPTVLSLHDFFFPCYRIHLIDAHFQLCPGPERGERCVSCLEGFGPPEEIHRRFSYMEQALQAPDVIVSPSAFLTQRMLDYFPTLHERLQTVPLGIMPVSATPKERQHGAPLRILAIGFLFPPKGAHVLVEAVKGLPADALTVSFYGASSAFWQPYADRVRTEAQGLPVRFYGAYAHDQLAAILAEHDVLVMSGICEETFSIVTREALMAGLPVVAARCGALPEVVHDGMNGLLFEPGDAADLRRCLARLIAEPELLEQLRLVAPPIKTMGEYAGEMEEIYGKRVTASPSQLLSLQRKLVERHQANTVLSQEHERLRAEAAELATHVASLQVQQEQLSMEKHRAEQERDLALASAQELRKELAMRDQELREREARLAAIYASTAWKLYRGYAALRRILYQRPLDNLTRWLTQGEQKTVQILQNADSWIDPAEIGVYIPPYRRTFAGPGFINENHRFFTFCPVKEEILIEIGIPGWLRREDALKLYEMAYFTSGHILELGTYRGLSTAILAQAVKDAGKRKLITSVDLDSTTTAEAKRHLEQRKLDMYVQLGCAEATQFCRELLNNKRTFGLVFVDHSHAYRHVSDICQLLPSLLSKGGFCLFHDFNDVRNNDVNNLDHGVSRAVYDNLDMKVFDFYGIYGSTGLYRKKV